jgi:hypothetical protein
MQSGATMWPFVPFVFFVDRAFSTTDIHFPADA